MKRIIAVSIIFCLIFSLSAQSQLSEEAEEEFMRMHLSIENRGHGMGGGNVGYYGNVTVNIETWSQWIAYRGFNKIKESNFFSIAGFEQEAIQAGKFEKLTRNLIITGIVLESIGLITMFASLGSDADNSFIIPLVFVSAGAPVMVIGMTNRNKNKYPASVGKMAMERYNRKLLESLE